MSGHILCCPDFFSFLPSRDFFIPEISFVIAVSSAHLKLFPSSSSFASFTFSFFLFWYSTYYLLSFEDMFYAPVSFLLVFQLSTSLFFYPVSKKFHCHIYVMLYSISFRSIWCILYVPFLLNVSRYSECSLLCHLISDLSLSISMLLYLVLYHFNKKKRRKNNPKLISIKMINSFYFYSVCRVHNSFISKPINKTWINLYFYERNKFTENWVVHVTVRT